MSQTLYLECYSGISGDMTVAALLDLGVDEEVLKEGLQSLGVDGYEIQISRVKKSGIDMCDFHVMLDEAHENHDHDMEYLHGHSHSNEAKSHSHYHGHSQECEEEDGCCGHKEHHHSHHHQHRGLKEILEIIESSQMTERAKAIASRIFRIIGQAEAKAHGVELSQVHFHEVGAVDSIVDIAAVAICLDNLNIGEVIVSPLYEGEGCIRCQHGMIPVPAPAVANIVEEYGLPMHRTKVQGELVTPTGAAIAAAIKTSDQLPESFTIEKLGMGAGKRKYDTPGMLRAMLIRS